jgi:amino acid adenylation domain-containing protein
MSPSPLSDGVPPVDLDGRENDVAVVGMACRLPGARDAAELWRNLCAGVESISFFSEDELREAGVSPDALRDPAFVPAYGALPEAWCFDAPFFGVSRREAQAMDPQHRVLLECAWSALEDAGVDPARFPGAVAVFAGSATSSPHLRRVLADEALVADVGREVALFANARDFLTTRISYKLGLRGPSVVVQTACSTSLVAIHLACQSLLNHECDLALAGGATVSPEQVSGYRHQEGGILSPDGHCRAFDARAGGTISASGAGIVALKRFADAVRDGDPIRAVVKGSAINNDGAGKVGFTAPSVKGQAQAIAEALEVAGVDPAEVSYVETHGTGTALGDPVEIAALSQVFRTATDQKGFCALGALKASIGHTDSAAGVAGFIKTVLALEHRTIPPTLHFTSPNPETGLEDSPFFVNTALRRWETDDGVPRRAGVSSFGMGGTNAHAVLEEAPALPPSAPTDAAQLLVLSAKSEAALERMRARLAAHLAEHPDLPPADVAFTLQEGRAAHPHRWAAAARDAEEARAALAGEGGRKPVSRRAAERAPSVAFLFPGQGTQHAGMARELYGQEPVFRAVLDRCADLLAPELGLDLRAVLFPVEAGEEEANALLRETRLTQPALFAVEYALAKLWTDRGVQPAAMLGHSIGEYVAACLAGVFTLENALRLVAARGRLMQSLSAGAMLAVPLPEAEVRPLLPPALSLAAVNSAAHCVVSGDFAGVDAMEALLAGRGVAARRLHTSHAFHSAAMDPVLDAFAAEVRKARPGAPSLPFVSNLTGDWITAAQAADPGYWVRHLRETVRFADGVGKLLDDPARVLLEVGPGETLGTFARRHERADAGRVIVRSLPRADRPDDSALTVLEAAGALWTAGVEVDWSALRGARRRVPLPTYPFDRTQYRVLPKRAPSAVQPSAPGGAAAPPRIPQPETEPVAATSTQAPDRRSRVAAAVADLFARLLGAEAARLDPSASFLELGADSLLLMQASRTIESSFGVKVPFRNLLEGLSTVDGLAGHLDGVLPADFALPGEPPAPVQTEAPAAVAAVAAHPAAASVPAAPAGAPIAVQAPRLYTGTDGEGGGLQDLFAQQLAVIHRQLDLLGGAPAQRPPRAPAAGDGNGHHEPGGPSGPNGSHGANGSHAPVPSARLERVQAAQAGVDGEEAPASHGPHRPVSATLGLGGGWTERQAAHFARLVERYTARTRRSKEYAAENRPHLSDNRASLNFRMATKELMYPIVGERSEGSRLWDLDGNEYVDFTIGFGVHFFGHRPPFVMEAVEEQLRRGFHLGPQSDLAGRAARLLAELTGMERVTFCNTGSEAVMTALRMARAVTGREKVVLFEGSYHGCFDGILARRAGGAKDGVPRARPVAPGTPQGMVDGVVVLSYGAPEALAWIEANAAEVAAVLVEPVQNRNPEFHPREFLRGLRALTARTGAVLVFDEMITGLRLEAKGAQGFYGIEADLATYGKVIGGGFPLGVVAGSARFMDAIDGGAWRFGDDSYPAANQTFFAGTFCKHPVTMAAACAVLSHLQERGQALYDELNARTARLVADLRRVIAEEGAPLRILSCASLFHFRPEPRNPFGDLLFYHLLERGFYIWEGRACFLSTAHTDEDCARLVAAFRDSIHALREGGFLPERPGPDGGAPGPGVRGEGDRVESTPANLKIFPSPEATSAAPRSFPLTPAQRQVWVHAQLGDDASRAYNSSLAFGVRGRVDAGALQAALADVTAHHEALRTVFDPSGEVQHVLPAVSVPLTVDGRDAPGGEGDGDELRAALKEAVRPVFDLAAGPLLRAHLHRRGPDFTVVQLVVHHLAADALGAATLRRDLDAAYRARRDGRAPRLPAAMQFGEYAALLAAHAAGHAGREAEWLARFEGAAPLALPYDRPRAAGAAQRAARQTLEIDPALAGALREASRREGCTLFMTLLAGVLAVLHRAGGGPDVLVGIPSAGRPFPGSAEVVGHCVDVLPIRSRVGGTERVRDHLRAVRALLLDAYEDEVFSFARLQERLQLPRGPGAAPLISLVFNLEPGGGGGGGAAPTFGGMAREAVAAPALSTPFDLDVDAVERGAAIELACTYNADLFDAATVAGMLARLRRVLAQMAADAGTPLAALELMDAPERRLVVDVWNRTGAGTPAERCIHHLVEAQVERTPAAVALEGAEVSLTYAELNARADRLARRLAGMGVGVETRVGLCLERTPELVVAILAVLKAGGAWVPLDPAYPAARLAFMLADSGARVLLTHERLRGGLSIPPSVAVLGVDADEGESVAAAETSPAAARPEGLAYVVYTSGSTGTPKGVAVEHRALASYVVHAAREYGVGPGDRVLQFTSISFDPAAEEIFAALSTGATLVLRDEEMMASSAAFWEACRRRAVTLLDLPTAVWAQMVPHLEAEPTAVPPSLRVVVVGGEPVPAAAVRAWRSAAPAARLLNSYGPTETTIGATLWDASAAPAPGPGAAVPIGAPVPGTRAYVLDERMRPAPAGVSGELYLGGAQVARGYPGRAALTAERFVPDPFSPRPGARLYRTGDRARWLAGGALAFLGRLDEQVKVRGVRVEPGEVEAALRAVPGVEACAVAAREDRPGETRLVAWIAGSAEVEEVRAALARTLPGPMLPAAFVRMDALPLSPNGKVDRRALPVPGAAWPAERHVAPRTPAEEVLAGIWAEVLGVERVGARDSFFDLGGHSLVATRMASRVRAVFGIELPLREVFEAPTVAELAERIEALRRADQPRLPPVVAVARETAPPLSFAQERLWFLDRLRPGEASYNVPVALRLRGALDAAALERALGEIVRRHEVLRTTFAEAEGGPVQVIAPFAGFTLAEEDAAGADDGALRRRATEEGARPFDLAAGPLFRASLLRVSADDHVLLMAMHHAVSDGWSVGVLLRELSALYEAYENGAESPLAPLPVQYADFAAWQRDQLRGEALDARLAWWKGRLSGAPALLELPADRARPAVMSHRGGHERIAFSGAVLDALRELARREGATLYMVLLGVFQSLLSRYGGGEDVVVGSPSAGRTRGEVEGLIGFFVNTLVLRTDLSGDPTFREVLRRVRDVTLGAYEHQEVPFEKLVEEMQPERSLSYSPLFQVMFTLHTGEPTSAALGRVAVEGVALDAGTVKFDLNLSMAAGHDALWAGLGYSTDLFERDTALRMLGHLGRVLEQVAADADVRLSELELLGEAERARVVHEWNATDAAYPADATIHALFEAQAARRPDATAVVSECETLTYAELNARANRLAHHLRAMGVRPDVRVGLCVERSPAMVVGVLAVLKAGGVFVPLDPRYPADRLAYMLADSAPAVVLAQKQVRDRIRTDVPVLELDAASPAWADQPATDPERGALTPAHPAYVTYTSGSTGKPKGVPAVHHKVLNLIHWYGREFAITERDAVLLVMSFSFDGTYRNLFAPLFAGAQLHLAGEPFDPARIVAQLAANPICLVNLTPSAFQALRAADSEGALARLRTVVLVGEPVQPRALLEMPEPRPEFVNLYGPTECSGITTYHRLSRDLAGYLERPVPVGRPIPNSRIYILDAAGTPVPVGVAGELHIGGTPVGIGYQNRPDQTAERFIADPFSGEQGARLYRTGDRARWLADGTIELLGRMDFQVKVRGYRVEPEEVETRLVEHPAVRQAVVLVREDAPGEQRLVAYWIGDAVEVGTLRAHLAARLPDYMVPAAYVRLDAFPLTPNGKLDRRALPAPGAGAFATRPWEAPRGEVEEAVARVWAEVLRLERVGRGDHFFELGGHSLRAVQVVSRLRRALGVEVALGELFVHPVMADFAAAVSSAAGGVLPDVTPVPREGDLPLSFAQTRLWFIDRMGGAGGAYNIPLRLRLAGTLDREALGRALERIVQRHEVLRTTFAQVGGEPVQRIHPMEESGFRIVDHDLAGGSDARARLRALLEDEAGAPFDLERGPVVRARLARLAEDDHVLMVTLHHVAADGWSVGVLVDELSALYRAFAAGRPDPLPPLPVQYADYAAWQRRWLEGEALRRQEEYWQGTLAGAPERLELPTDRARPVEQDFTGAAVDFALDAELTAELTALARRHGATLFTTLLAGWAAVLGRLSGQREVVVGTPAANRGRREIEGLIGFFVNTLALRVDLSGSPSVAELLGRVKERALAAQAHQDLPFERVVELVQPARSLAHTPLFQAMVAWQNTPDGSLELPGLTLGRVEEAPHAVAKYDLTLTLREAGGRVVGGVLYATALFDRETVERWVGYLRRVLREMAVADRPERRLSELPMMTEAERKTLLETWSGRGEAFPVAGSLHGRFEARAAARPDAVAVSFEGRSLTYAQLNARANRLAHYLVRLGVGPEVRVGVCLERSLEMVVSLLAVLKAGGAYVPLDPGYPAERLAYMLDDSAVPLVLVQEALRGSVPAREGVEVLAVDALAERLASEPAENPAGGAGPDSLAYVIYTSGSTGRPKGVMNAHRGVVNRLVWMQAHFGIGADDVVLQKTPFSFDVSVWEFFWPLQQGARLVMARPDGHRDPAYLRDVVEREGVTTLHFVPSMLQPFVEAVKAGRCASLRHVVCSGEALPPALVRRFHDRFAGPVVLTNLYGPTEAAVDVSCWTCPRDGAAGVVPIGRPVWNTALYVLDAGLQPVPVGVPGELYIGGVQVARGYLGRAGLTAERFVPDPFSAEGGARLYRTGDRARWRADGAIEYLGRLDDQVKVRGFRIEPGEIESALLAQPGVSAAAVIVRGEGDEAALVAYVVPAEGAALPPALREALKSRLPDYMVPAAFVPLERIPLTPNGKLDRGALPEPDAAGGEAADGYVAPRTPVEEVLAGIWAEVLRRPRIGATDDFFELGGHSLLVMRLIAHVEDAFGVELPIRAVFAAPTLEAMAAGIEQRVLEDILKMSDAEAEELAAHNLVAGGSAVDATRARPRRQGAEPDFIAGGQR